MAYVRNIVVLTGAGISADSGVPTFRTGKDGKMGWDTGLTVHPLERGATFRRNVRLRPIADTTS